MSLVRRGLDNLGNAANSIEQEQICWGKDNAISSFVQLRGSVPRIWTQRLNSNYKPAIEISNIEESWNSIDKHFYDLKNQYTKISECDREGSVVCINLLDDQGFEGKLTDAYESAVTKCQDSQVSFRS
jgi:hypothetical protein